MERKIKKQGTKGKEEGGKIEGILTGGDRNGIRRRNKKNKQERKMRHGATVKTNEKHIYLSIK